MINEFLIIDSAENEDDLDRQWSEWNQQTHANRKRSNNTCLSKYGMTNLDRYEHFKSKFNKQPIDPVTTEDPEVSGDNQDSGTGDDSVQEGATNNFTVRRLTKQDYKEVAVLDGKYKSTVRDALDEENYKKLKMLAYGVLSNNKLIGYCIVRGDTDRFPPEIKEHKDFNETSFMLTDVYVLPEYRGQGAATKLITEAIKLHPDVKNNHVFLIVHDKKLYEFYKKSGFKVIDDYMMIKESGSFQESELLYPEYNPSITTDEALQQGGFYDCHGVWNNIMKVPSDPKRIYRGRVECLIIKKGEVYLCKRPTDEYRLPGGSFEIKNDNVEQCYNECKEEARILIKNTKFTGITYTRTYTHPADWARDLPVQWTGQYIEVYVADFDRYYNGQIDRNDKDEDMYNNGRFYNIDEIYGILRDEHKKAIDIFVRKITIKESSNQSNHLYFLSEENKDGQLLSPRVPDNYLTKNGYEDNKTSRVCFAPSINKALIGLSNNLKGKKLYVHIPKRGDNYNVYKPSIKEVPDANITGEVWIKEDVKIECIGCIDVTNANDTSYSYTYGDNNTAKLYSWNWKWEDQYIKEDTQDGVEVVGGADHINTDQIAPSPLNSVTNEMYNAAREWSGRSNIKMILERYDLDALEREYNDFMLQTYYHRKISNQESIRIFGFNNLVHYQYLKSKLLERDKTNVQVDDVVDSNDNTETTISECTIPSNLKKKMDIIKEELSYTYDKIIVHNMLDDLWRENAKFSDKAIVKNFIKEVFDYMEGNYQECNLLPYYSPRDMDELGVFNEDPEDNFYKVPSNWAEYEWYDLYTRTGDAGEWWYEQTHRAYGEMIKNLSNENKQRVLELGWNPELPFTIDIIKETSKLTKEKLDKRYNVEVIDITESLKDLDDYQEVPYIPKNINLYRLNTDMSYDIDAEHTTGRIFTDYNGNYAAHISIYNNDIVGIGSCYKGPELLLDLIDWAIREKGVNRCYCSRTYITLKRVLKLKDFIQIDTNKNGIIIYALPETDNPGTILTQGDLVKYVTPEIEHKASAYKAKEILANMLNDNGWQGYSQYKNCFELRDVESDDGMYIFAKWDISSLDDSQVGVFFDILSNIISNIIAKLNGFIIDDVNRSKTYGFLGTYPNSTLSEAVMPAKIRNTLKDSNFGLPKERKYPLNDESHVRSAIKFFNYVDEKNEPELAKNIIKKINKYGMEVHIGEGNRFSKYYSTTHEATKSKEKLLPVYIVTCYTASAFGMAIQKFTGSLYSHAALGFDETLNKLYSFNVAHSDGKNGGLSLESIQQYVKDNDNADLNVSVVYLKEKDHRKLQERLDMYLKNAEKTSYNFRNIFNIVVNKAEDGSEQFSMVCSQFVDSMFKAINVDLTNKPSNLVTPGDLSIINNPKVYKIYEGKAKGYNPKKTEIILHKLIGSAQAIKESVFIRNARIGRYFAIPIFEAKELPIGFDDSGALLIKNYKNIDYNVEYSRSNKLLKSYKVNKNYEAMKYELCKLWFINTVLLKKIEVAKNKEEKETLIKIRAKIMNDFTIYLNEVNKNVSGFNFSEYYEQTPFSDTVIKISGSTLKYSAQYLKAAIKSII